MGQTKAKCLRCCGCASLAGTDEELPGQEGYSVVDFVNDGLVPVWGYVHWKPMDPRRVKELHDQLIPLNERIGKVMDKNHRRPRDGAPKDNELPLEVICLAGLWNSEVIDDPAEIKKRSKEGDDKEWEDDKLRNFEFDRETQLFVKVAGALNFPAGVEPQSPKDVEMEMDPDNKIVRNGKKKKDSHDVRWFLSIEAVCVLKIDVVDEDDGVEGAMDESGSRLVVKCLSMTIRRECDVNLHWAGDPMVTSWLPENDIKDAVEELLDAKLQHTIRNLLTNEEKETRWSAKKFMQEKKAQQQKSGGHG
jgi:hypothetical protein